MNRSNLIWGMIACLFSFSAHSSMFSKSSIKNVVDHFTSDLEKTQFNERTCNQSFRGLYDRLFDLNSEEVDFSSYTKSDVELLVKSSFNARILIHKKIGSMDKLIKSSPSCFSSIHKAVRALRYLEDFFVEYAYNQNFLESEDEYIGLTGEGVHFLVNPKFSDFKSHEDLQSGDVIISRGNAYTSAAIARIGVNDSQFSHVSFVYQDEDGVLYTSEAHIEIGSLAEPFEKHLTQNNGRTVVLRFEDQELAHRASKLMYEKIKYNRYNIQYDFAMDYKDHERIFCSEVVPYGFELAAEENGSAEAVDIPMYKTKFNRGLIPFLNKLGIPASYENIESFNTFAPGDLQFDHRFELVAEWRDPSGLEKLRYKDAILQHMFTLMETEGYSFDSTILDTIKVKFARYMRHSWLRLYKDKFPLNMTIGQLKIFSGLDRVAEIYNQEIEEEKKRKLFPSRPLSMKEIFSVLDRFTKSDRTKAYKYFHP